MRGPRSTPGVWRRTFRTQQRPPFDACPTQLNAGRCLF
nr:MAG TPA: hypothetical protein [Caudoviricetes sp.]